jgi:hypothetical protein
VVALEQLVAGTTFHSWQSQCQPLGTQVVQINFVSTMSNEAKSGMAKKVKVD